MAAEEDTRRRGIETVELIFDVTAAAAMWKERLYEGNDKGEEQGVHHTRGGGKGGVREGRPPIAMCSLPDPGTRPEWGKVNQSSEEKVQIKPTKRLDLDPRLQRVRLSLCPLCPYAHYNQNNE